MIPDLFEDKLKELELTAVKTRELIIETLLEAGSGHSAGPLGMADIFTAFYFHILNHDPKNPNREDRDRLILSNGHICPVRYVSMALSGYFPVEEIKKIIDRNNIQIDGFTENVMPLEPLKAKYESFNWEVLETDGNNIRTFIDAVR